MKGELYPFFIHKKRYLRFDLSIFDKIPAHHPVPGSEIRFAEGVDGPQPTTDNQVRIVKRSVECLVP